MSVTNPARGEKEFRRKDFVKKFSSKSTKRVSKCCYNEREGEGGERETKGKTGGGREREREKEREGGREREREREREELESQLHTLTLTHILTHYSFLRRSR
jgi:hypothetical protein